MTFFPGICKWVITIIESIVLINKPSLVTLNIESECSMCKSSLGSKSFSPCIFISTFLYLKKTPGQPLYALNLRSIFSESSFYKSINPDSFLILLQYDASSSFWAIGFIFLFFISDKTLVIFLAAMSDSLSSSSSLSDSLISILNFL